MSMMLFSLFTSFHTFLLAIQGKCPFNGSYFYFACKLHVLLSGGELLYFGFCSGGSVGLWFIPNSFSLHVEVILSKIINPELLLLAVPSVELVNVCV